MTVENPPKQVVVVQTGGRRAKHYAALLAFLSLPTCMVGSIAEANSAMGAGWLLLFAGMILYIVGRFQD